MEFWILDVYYQHGSMASQQQVRDALQSLKEESLQVVDNHGYPCIRFPRSRGWKQFEKFTRELESLGFETDFEGS